MAFERLNNELLIEIVKYATLDGPSISSLRSLASVNRILNSIAIPMLYSKFDEVSHTSVPKLLRTILANPELATYVRSYTGYGIWNGPSPEKVRFGQMGASSQDGEVLDVSGWEDDDFACCRETLDMIELDIEIDPERVESWMDRIREGRWHALTGLLLLLLFNLEDIEMIDYRWDEEEDVNFALGIAAILQESESTSPFVLEHLTDVSLSAFTPEDDDDPYTGFHQQPEPDEWLYFEDVMPFLMLPSVESMAISGLANQTSRFSAAPRPLDTTFETKDLEINNTSLEMSHLEELLHLFPSLSRFAYNHVAKEHEPDFLPQTIAKALAHLRPCLEELDLSSMCEQNGAYTTPRAIGSLAGFESLKHIEIEWDILFGYPDAEGNYSGRLPTLRDILPGVLESLTISRGGFPDCEGQLRGLLQVKEEKFPALKKIKMKGLGGFFKDPMGLRRDFKANGVKLLL